MGVTADSSQANIDRLAYERKVVEPFVGSFGWRTLFNALWPAAGWVTTVVLYTNDTVPLIAAIVLCAIFIQALYMPVHESVHRTISAGRSRYVWLDRAVGSFAAWVLCTSFVEHRRQDRCSQCNRFSAGSDRSQHCEWFMAGTSND